MPQARPRAPLRVLLTALLTALLIAAPADAAHRSARRVALIMYVTLDQVAAASGDAHGKVGDVDRIRLTYDATAVDPTTHRVKLVNFQHWQNGRWRPTHPDPVMMPVDDSWLDLGQTPYRLHLEAAVVHGDPIIIDVDETAQRLTIHPQSDPTAVVISGRYRIDARPAP
jgi:hypothetical protein